MARMYYSARRSLALMICPEMGVEARLKAIRETFVADGRAAARQRWLEAERAVVAEEIPLAGVDEVAAKAAWLLAERTAAECPSGDDMRQRLKSFRKANGLSQRDMSRALGFAVSLVGIIEGGRCEPSREFLKKMRSVYGVSADWLLFGDAAK